MFSFARSTVEIEKRAVSVIFEENPEQDLLSRYIIDTMETHSKALTASNKDMEVAYFYYVKYLHMCQQLRTLIYSGGSVEVTFYPFSEKEAYLERRSILYRFQIKN